MKSPKKERDQCHKCFYKVHPDMVTNTEGWCYMFRDRPQETCRQFRIVKPPTNEAALWPSDQHTDAHNQRQIELLLEQTQRIERLKEDSDERDQRIAELEVSENHWMDEANEQMGLKLKALELIIQLKADRKQLLDALRLLDKRMDAYSSELLHEIDLDENLWAEVSDETNTDRRQTGRQ